MSQQAMQQTNEQPPATQGENKLSTQLERRKIEPHQWNTLKRSFFPDASNDSVLMYIDYCRARGLDVMKRPAHIVPMKYKDNGEWKWRDVILPGIYDYRMTAHSTGEYLGHSKPEYGEVKDQYGVEAPEWCAMTMYRWNGKANRCVEFPVTVFFSEAVATFFDKDAKAHRANSRWTKAPIQMLTKCTEAAGLREAFPSEIGGEPTYEEMVDQHTEAPAKPEDRSRGDLAERLSGEGGNSSRVVHTVHPGEAAQDDSPNEPEPQAEPPPEKADAAAPSLDDVLAKVKQAKATEDLAEAIADSEHLPEADVEKVREAYRKKVKELNQAKTDAAANAFGG